MFLGDLIRPVGPDLSRLPLQTSSIAELLRAAVHFVEVAPDESARDHELKLERDFLTLNLKRYAAHREPDDACPWTFLVTDPLDVEQVTH